MYVDVISLGDIDEDRIFFFAWRRFKYHGIRITSNGNILICPVAPMITISIASRKESINLTTFYWTSTHEYWQPLWDHVKSLTKWPRIYFTLIRYTDVLPLGCHNIFHFDALIMTKQGAACSNGGTRYVSSIKPHTEWNVFNVRHSNLLT